MQAQKRKEMYKKIFLSLGLILGISLFANQKMLATTITDSTTTEQYTPFYWDVISDVDKVLQHEKMKDLNKRAIDH